MDYVIDKRICCVCDADIPCSKRSDAKYCSDTCGNRFRHRKHYYSHIDEMKAKRVRDNARHTHRIISRIKHRCKKGGIPFNLEPADIIIPSICPVLGLDISPEQQKGSNNPLSVSVDRIDPGGGYIKGNIRIISNRANLLKSNATIEELEAVLADLKRLRHG